MGGFKGRVVQKNVRDKMKYPNMGSNMRINGNMGVAFQSDCQKPIIVVVNTRAGRPQLFIKPCWIYFFHICWTDHRLLLVGFTKHFNR